jgi:pimeloyl-ACP methyl ester carboxylesterase
MSRPLSAPFVTLVVLLVVALALLAGCAALVETRAERREAAWEASHPPEGRFVTVEGRQVHVVEAGQPAGAAPAIVLIHGANGNLRDFTFGFAERLAPDWRVIAVDRPGLGWSESWGAADSDPRVQARILRQAVATLGVERPVVLGHSYGGAVAMVWALEAPEETAALVLLAGATQPWDGPLGAWYRLAATPLGRAGRSVIAGLAPEALAERTVGMIFEPDPVPSGYAAHFGLGLSMRRAQQRINARQVNALLGHVTEMQRDYADLMLPIEAVHGSADTIVGLEIHSARLAREVPGARLSVIEGGGHMPHHRHPEVVLAAIDRAARRAGLR